MPAMTFEEFFESLTLEKPPRNLTPALLALWEDRNENWEAAHRIVQDESDNDSAWVHAYLHRKEGDQNNAGYWYARAGKPASHGSLNDEWEEIAESLLSGRG